MSQITPSGTHDMQSTALIEEHLVMTVTVEKHLFFWQAAQAHPTWYLDTMTNFEHLLAYTWPDTSPPITQFSWIGYLYLQIAEQCGFHVDDLVGVKDMLPGFYWGSPREEMHLQAVNQRVAHWVFLEQRNNTHFLTQAKEDVEAYIYKMG